MHLCPTAENPRSQQTVLADLIPPPVNGYRNAQRGLSITRARIVAALEPAVPGS
jgi:hypothetical protein